MTVISETSKRLAKQYYFLKGKQRPPIVVRMMFANIIGVPLNCNEVVKELTSHLSKDDPDTLRLWVGAWRRDTSWNHAKIIAVDGNIFIGCNRIIRMDGLVMMLVVKLLKQSVNNSRRLTMKNYVKKLKAIYGYVI